MKKERMAILKMVNDGKITVDEAVKLMETIKGTKSVDPGDMIESVREKVCEIVEDAKTANHYLWKKNGKRNGRRGILQR